MEARIAAMLLKKQVKKPVVIPEPIPIIAPEPEPVVAPEPEPVVASEPEPVVASEPEPVIAPEPEPVVAPEPEPVIATEPEPVIATEPEPVIASEPEPVVAPEHEQVVASEPEQVVAPEHEQVVASEPEPVVIHEPEPVIAPAPVVASEHEPVSVINNTNIPKLIFIVPYRDRPQHLHFFKEQMAKVLSIMPKTDYKMFFAHQEDTRSFNRGAMKNIGFIAVKNKYPNDYKNITLVFNDVDTMPYTKRFLDYDTVPGIVKHFYGYKFALGGIVSIKAGDFEKTTGFPNFWAWGYEDNMLKYRVERSGLRIDHSQFYPINDGNIIQLKDGNTRNVSRTEYDKYMSNDTEGFNDITNLTYNIDEETGFINVTSFQTRTPASQIITKEFSLDSGIKPFVGRKRAPMGRMF